MTEKQTVNLKINGEEVEAPAGEMLIKVCHDRGLDVPFFCYHPGLVPEGNCRMCLVEVAKAPKPMPACTTPVADGMEIETHSGAAKDARADVLEFMLANHPLDCPICDKSGECLLQDHSYDHGKDGSRMVDVKQLKPTKDLGNGVKLWGNRCISCTRCVRFTTEVAGIAQMGQTGRGEDAEITSYLNQTLDSNLQGNI
ncbi:MAG: NADH-quinone oxidoreductase subunit G, partial [Planctomycetes bacterium]|nr:NADH-quinone oxidoreductase subunit G [Planctomycetota bacterium]